MSKELTEFDTDPYSLFLFAMSSPSTKEKCVPRLNKFFEFINLNGTMQEKCSTFVKSANEQPSWALGSVIKFLQMNKDRVERKEITAATALNSVKVIKLFCEMNDVLLPWKRITRGLPKARRYADDRAPTLAEIQKILEYPDIRIKAIVSTMVSSGIRLGAWNYLKWKHVSPIKKEGKIVAKLYTNWPVDLCQRFLSIKPRPTVEEMKDIFYHQRLEQYHTLKWDDKVESEELLKTLPQSTDPYIKDHILSTNRRKKLMIRVIRSRGENYTYNEDLNIKILQELYPSKLHK
jgi:hypothetical protein